MQFKKLYLIEKSILTTDQQRALQNNTGTFDRATARRDAQDLGLNKKETKAYVRQQKKAPTRTQEQNFIDMLRNGEVEGYSQNAVKNWNNAFIQVLMASVREDGYDTKTNPFLTYAKVIQNSEVPKMGVDAIPAWQTIRELLKSGKYRATEASLKNNFSQWITNPRAYQADDPTYKVKALAFLTSERAGHYGAMETRPIKEVIKAMSKSQIANLLDNWQTLNPEDNDGVDAQGEVETNQKAKLMKDDARSKKTLEKYVDLARKKLVAASLLDKRAIQAVLERLVATARVGDKLETALGRAISSTAAPSNAAEQQEQQT